MKTLNKMARSVLVSLLSISLMACGASTSTDDAKDKEIAELKAQLEELQQSSTSETAEATENTEEDQSDSSSDEEPRWTLYSCDSKLLDLSPMIAETTNDSTSHPAIRSLYVQVDAAVFDVSEGALTIQQFVDTLKSNPAEGDSYTFWINGEEEYTPDRLISSFTIDVYVAKYGYGYCGMKFTNPKSNSEPSPLSDFYTNTYSVYVTEPYVFGDEAVSSNKEIYRDSFDITTSTIEVMEKLNPWACQNIWYTGGIRYDGELYTGGKLKYEDATGFYEKIGLTKLESDNIYDYYKPYIQHDHYYIYPMDYRENESLYRGHILGYDCITGSDNEENMYYLYIDLHFDLKTQECVHAGEYINPDDVFSYDKSKKDSAVVIKGMDQTETGINYDAFMDKKTSASDLNGPYELMSDDDADFFSRETLKDVYNVDDVTLVEKKSMDDEGYLGWIMYKYNVDGEETIICVNIFSGQLTYGKDDKNVKEDYVVF